MFKQLIIGIAAALFASGCAVHYRAQPAADAYEQVMLSGEAVKLIKQQIPADTLFSLKPQARDGKHNALEFSLQGKLRQSGYAVQEVLPPSSRQKGDIEEMKTEGIALSIEFIPYTGTEYGELVVSIGNDRYSRLYLQKNRNTAPLSGWICRIGSGE